MAPCREAGFQRLRAPGALAVLLVSRGPARLSLPRGRGPPALGMKRPSTTLSIMVARWAVASPSRLRGRAGPLVELPCGACGREVEASGPGRRADSQPLCFPLGLLPSSWTCPHLRGTRVEGPGFHGQDFVRLTVFLGGRRGNCTE